MRAVGFRIDRGAQLGSATHDGGTTYARFRVSTDGDLGVGGMADDGTLAATTFMVMV